MDVKMPDGTIIANVPDDVTQSQLLKMVNNTKLTTAKQDPYKMVAQDNSATDNVLAGIGGAMKGLYLGGKQMLGFANQSDIDEHNKAMSGLRSTTSGAVGEVLGNAIPAAVTAVIPGANTYTGAALTGAVLNGMQPLAEGESRAWEAVKGAGIGGLGQGVANIAGRIVKPVQAVQSQADSALVQKAKDMGIKLNAAQETGSKPLRWIDSALDNLPYTAESQAAKKAAQRDMWQSNVLKQAGENANVASTEVLGMAYERLGNTFNALSQKTDVTLGNDFVNAIAAVDAKKTPFSTGVDSVIDKALDLASKGKISGSEYQNVRTSLTNAAKGAWSGNPELGQALKSLRAALDDAAEQSLSSSDRALWQEARSQYQALKTIQKATDPTTGAISPKKLVNELGRKNPNGMYFGAGDQTMPDIARVGKQFIADNLPDSGTAQRRWYMDLLTGGGGALGALGITGAVPPAAIIGAAAGAATPIAVQKALWGNGKYLRQGLLNPEYAQNAVRPLMTAAPIGLLSEVGK